MSTKTLSSSETFPSTIQTTPSPVSKVGLAVKRLIDLVVAFFGLLVFSPFFLVVGILLKRESPGPVFYRGSRLGKGGKIFGILKFRTMYECPESYQGTRITANDDERITPLGRWLRDTKINELPQLWNVLKGEMSLVGPRPEDPEIAKSWSEEEQHEVLSFRPGLTSPASVLYRNEEKLLSSRSVMDEYLRNIMPDKLRLDLLYVRTCSFLGDLDIIMWTFVALLPQKDPNPVPETGLYAGPLAKIARIYISWFAVDMVVALAATAATGIIWRLSEPLDLGWTIAITLAVGIGLLFGSINSFLGLKGIAWHTAKPAYVFDLAFSSGVTTTIIFLVNWFWPTGHFLPQGMIIEIGLVAFLGSVVVRYRQRLVTGFASRWMQIRRKATTMGERVLIIGAGECGLLATFLLEKSNLASVFSVVGMVDDDPRKHGMMVDGHPILGSTRNIPALVAEKNIGVILYAISTIKPMEQERILGLCRSSPARLVIIPDLIKILQDHLLKSSSEAPYDASMA